MRGKRGVGDDVHLRHVSMWPLNIAVRLALCDCLQEACQNKGHIVAWVKAVPKGRSNKCRQSCTEARLLPLWSDAQVHVVLKPQVSIDVPVTQIGVCVLGELYSERLHILKPVPVHAAGLGVHSLVANATENASALGQQPNTIVLHASRDT